mmetsp:Transcript_18076/g.25277  ORF Transcript_18076/g.25277 Transcript_18076/m.25277 type:complete len:249 (+) Transcript_18076:179-925(+)
MTCLIMWYSSLIPFPPSISLHFLAIVIALSQLFLLIMLIISGAIFPWSFSLPTCKQPNSPSVISVDISAKSFWISWFDAKGLPNCFLSKVYCLAVSMQNSAAPRAPQAIPNLALFRQPKGPLSPVTFGNKFSSGISTSSMTIWPVIEALRLNLPSILGAERPFIPFSKMNPLITFCSSLAHTTNTSAMGELVIQVLEPFRTHLFPFLTALVSMEPGSDPWLGSVRPKHPISSPVASFGRYFWRCCSVP